MEKEKESLNGNKLALITADERETRQKEESGARIWKSGKEML